MAELFTTQDTFFRIPSISLSKPKSNTKTFVKLVNVVVLGKLYNLGKGSEKKK